MKAFLGLSILCSALSLPAGSQAAAPQAMRLACGGPSVTVTPAIAANWANLAGRFFADPSAADPAGLMPMLHAFKQIDLENPEARHGVEPVIDAVRNAAENLLQTDPESLKKALTSKPGIAPLFEGLDDMISADREAAAMKLSLLNGVFRPCLGDTLQKLVESKFWELHRNLGPRAQEKIERSLRNVSLALTGRLTESYTLAGGLHIIHPVYGRLPRRSAGKTTPADIPNEWALQASRLVVQAPYKPISSPHDAGREEIHLFVHPSMDLDGQPLIERHRPHPGGGMSISEWDFQQSQDASLRELVRQVRILNEAGDKLPSAYFAEQTVLKAADAFAALLSLGGYDQGVWIEHKTAESTGWSSEPIWQYYGNALFAMSRIAQKVKVVPGIDTLKAFVESYFEGRKVEKALWARLKERGLDFRKDPKDQLFRFIEKKRDEAYAAYQRFRANYGEFSPAGRG
jgi:hypothetical protein